MYCALLVRQQRLHVKADDYRELQCLAHRVCFLAPLFRLAGAADASKSAHVMQECADGMQPGCWVACVPAALMEEA